MTEKKCSRCGERKLFDEFNKNKSKNDGHADRCRSCQKSYRQSNKEKIAKQKHEHYEANRERIREQQREYYKLNRSQLLEYQRKWSEANHDRKNNYKREWRKANPDYQSEYRRNNKYKSQQYKAKRNALKKSTSTTDPLELAEIALFYADCPEGWHVDHIIPLILGGAHELSNLQHLEAWINQQKYKKHPDEWDDPRPISCRA